MATYLYIFVVSLVILVALNLNEVRCMKLGHDGFGSINVTQLEKTDLSKNESGLICTDVDIPNPLEFFNNSPAFLHPSGFLRVELSVGNFFFQPTHVGKTSNFRTAEASIVLVNQTSLTKFEVCYRNLANAGPNVTADNSNAIVNWIFARQGLLGIVPREYSASNYGCRPLIEANASSHVFISMKHTGKIENADEFASHFDAVWLQSRDSFIETCWQDVPALRETHIPVSIQALIIPRDVAPQNLTERDYRVGTLSFNWPAEKNITGMCVEIPFSPVFPASPTVFASALIETGNVSDSYFTWIEAAGETGMQACVTQSYWATTDRTNVRSTAMNYLAVTNLLGDEQNVLMEGYVKLIFGGLDPSRVPALPISDVLFTTLFKNFVAEKVGEDASAFELIDIFLSSIFSSMMDMFFMRLHNVSNVQRALLAFEREFGVAPKLKINIPSTNVSSAEYKFFEAYGFNISRVPRLPVSSTARTESSCSLRRANYGICSTTTCGTEGLQSVFFEGSSSVKNFTNCESISFNRKCNQRPCISSFNAYGLFLTEDQRLHFGDLPSSSSGLSIGVIIAIVVSIVVVLIGGGIGIWLWQKKSKMHSHKGVGDKMHLVS